MPHKTENKPWSSCNNIFVNNIITCHHFINVESEYSIKQHFVMFLLNLQQEYALSHFIQTKTNQQLIHNEAYSSEHLTH